MIYFAGAEWSSLADAEPINQKNPIIFYQSVYGPQDVYSVDASSIEVDGFPLVNVWNPDTSSKWQCPPTHGQIEFVIENNSGAEVNYIAIAGHNFNALESSSVLIQSGSNLNSLTSRISTPSEKMGAEPVVLYFLPTTNRFIKITITRSLATTNNVIVSHIKLGSAMHLQRREFSGVAPGTISPRVKKTTYGSESGQYLGQIVHRSYKKAKCNQEKNTPEFVRSTVVPFINHCNGFPEQSDWSSGSFFYAWRPVTHPDEVVYGWTDSEISPTIDRGDGLGGLMSWGFSMDCIA